jgi:hypothetical protein
MARQRTTFGKLQRERDKQAKQQAKQERRAAMAREASETPPETVAPPDQADQARLMAAFAKIHDDLEAGRLSLEDFESKRDQLRDQLARCQ